MHEIVIPMVPSKNILGQSRWWRNSHNDREVWRHRVHDAVKDVEPYTLFYARVICDWQGRSKPVTSSSLIEAIEKETVDALREAGVHAAVGEVEVQQSGRGQGETRIVLDGWTVERCEKMMARGLMEGCKWLSDPEAV